MLHQDMGWTTTCRGVVDDMRAPAARLTSAITQVDCLCKCYIKTWGGQQHVEVWLTIWEQLLQDSRVCLHKSIVCVNVTSRHVGAYYMSMWGVVDDMRAAAVRLTSAFTQVDCLCKCYIKTWGGQEHVEVWLTIWEQLLQDSRVRLHKSIVCVNVTSRHVVDNNMSRCGWWHESSCCKTHEFFYTSRLFV
jgi:hypothetical protein